MEQLNNVSALAFDLDGTLVDSIEDLSVAANVMRETLGMQPLKTAVLASFVGDGIGKLVHRALSNHHDQDADSELWEKGFAIFVQYYAQHLTVHTQAYPQVVDTLALLKTLNLPLAVITNKAERFATHILKNLNLIDFFSIVIGGDTLTEKKPAALPIIHVADVLNIDPKTLVMVGDSRNDILTAKNAGSLSCGVCYGYENMLALQQNPQTKADIVIQQFGELYDHLQQE